MIRKLRYILTCLVFMRRTPTTAAHRSLITATPSVFMCLAHSLVKSAIVQCLEVGRNPLMSGYSGLSGMVLAVQMRRREYDGSHWYTS
jgi:hypothetical protein